jgi:hypothetical protein
MYQLYFFKIYAFRTTEIGAEYYILHSIKQTGGYILTKF